MKWIEVIGIRSATGNREILEGELLGLLHLMQKGDAAAPIKVLRRLNVESDLCVHLHHDSPRAEPSGSRLGLRLVAEMAALGLVHHSMWSEIIGRKKS